MMLNGMRVRIRDIINVGFIVARAVFTHCAEIN